MFINISLNNYYSVNKMSENNKFNRKNTVSRNITIRKDQDKWIRNHTEINFSGFVQTKVDELVNNFKLIEKNNKKKG
jgi:hypothetical protein